MDCDMKAEINNENKAKFFGLYLNLRNSIIRTGFVNRDNINPNGVDEHDSLLLKPLSSISDEDLEAINFTFPNGKPDDLSLKFEIDGISNKWIAYSEGRFVEGILCLTHFDILRSLGYAISWMGLSVKQMVEAGWIKLIES